MMVRYIPADILFLLSCSDQLKTNLSVFLRPFGCREDRIHILTDSHISEIGNFYMLQRVLRFLFTCSL